MRLDLDLADGSRVIGVPAVEAVPIETAYAKFNIPLKQILSIKMDADHETAALELRNGDKLKGALGLEAVKLETIFGKVTIGREHVREVRVVLAGRALPPALKEGLVLHYAFDRVEDEKVTDQSGKEHHGRVRGATWAAARAGDGAFEFNGRTACIEVGPTELFKTQGALSGCAWIRRLSRDGIVLSNYRGGAAYAGQFFFQIDGEGVLDLIFGQGGPTEFLRYRAAKPDLVPAGAWHHIAFTYDEQRGARQKARFFIDGDEIREYAIQGEGTGGVVLQTSDLLKIMSDGAGAAHSKGAVDEVMLWQRALSAQEVRQLYELQQ